MPIFLPVVVPRALQRDDEPPPAQAAQARRPPGTRPEGRKDPKPRDRDLEDFAAARAAYHRFRAREAAGGRDLGAEADSRSQVGQKAVVNAKEAPTRSPTQKPGGRGGEFGNTTASEAESCSQPGKALPLLPGREHPPGLSRGYSWTGGVCGAGGAGGAGEVGAVGAIGAARGAEKPNSVSSGKARGEAGLNRTPVKPRGAAPPDTNANAHTEGLSALVLMEDPLAPDAVRQLGQARVVSRSGVYAAGRGNVTNAGEPLSSTPSFLHDDTPTSGAGDAPPLLADRSVRGGLGRALSSAAELRSNPSAASPARAPGLRALAGQCPSPMARKRHGAFLPPMQNSTAESGTAASYTSWCSDFQPSVMRTRDAAPSCRRGKTASLASPALLASRRARHHSKQPSGTLPSPEALPSSSEGGWGRSRFQGVLSPLGVQADFTEGDEEEFLSLTAAGGDIVSASESRGNDEAGRALLAEGAPGAPGALVSASASQISALPTSGSLASTPPVPYASLTPLTSGTDLEVTVPPLTVSGGLAFAPPAGASMPAGTPPLYGPARGPPPSSTLMRSWTESRNPELSVESQGLSAPDAGAALRADSVISMVAYEARPRESAFSDFSGF